MPRQFSKLAHSLYECKYHIVFCPKYRYKRAHIKDGGGGRHSTEKEVSFWEIHHDHRKEIYYPMLSLLNSISEKEFALETFVQEIKTAVIFRELIHSAWRLAMAIAVQIVEDELEKRAQKKTLWRVSQNSER